MNVKRGEVNVCVHRSYLFSQPSTFIKAVGACIGANGVQVGEHATCIGPRHVSSARPHPGDSALYVVSIGRTRSTQSINLRSSIEC